MFSGVKVKEQVGVTLISIRPRRGAQLLTAFALICMTASVIKTRASFSTVMSAWGIPAFVIILYALWEFLREERIHISDQEILIEKRIGPMKLGESVAIKASLIQAVEVEERHYAAKGGRYVSRTIVFLTKAGVAAKTWQLSREDSDALLAGPFRFFASAKN
jgi:hypothetical protein